LLETPIGEIEDTVRARVNKSSLEMFSGSTMLIDDLEFLNSLEKPQNYLGGVYVSAQTTTFAGHNFGYASGSAAAIGQQTSTVVQTSTNVNNTAFYNYSSANANAWAYAQTGSDRARATSYQSSTYVSVRS
jgi:hypothetical protein